MRNYVTCKNGLLQNPNEVEDWLGDFNTNSKEVIRDAYAVPPLRHAKEGDKFQFERLGELMFCLIHSNVFCWAFEEYLQIRDSFSQWSLTQLSF